MSETKRLYHDDAYLREFDARILSRTIIEGRPAIVLDRTAFYPEAGGQSGDRGTINGVEVLDVREDGETIVHILAGDLDGDAVHGSIDGARRFDRMQQHSGQHVLSQAFLEVLKGETHSFHIGDDVATLEIGVGQISDEEMDKVEARANAVVFEDRAVKTYFVPEERIHEIPLRRPPKVSGIIRIVEVEGFDHSACGGTHCRRTGEIGLIKILKEEKIRGRLRFDFVCGGRALRDYREKNRIVRKTAAVLSAADRDIPEVVEKVQADAKILRKTIKTLEERIAIGETKDIIRDNPDLIIMASFADKRPDEARFLALNIIRQAAKIVLFATVDAGTTHFIFAASPSTGFDVKSLIPTVQSVVPAKGGGSTTFVEIVVQKSFLIDETIALLVKKIKTSLLQ